MIPEQLIRSVEFSEEEKLKYGATHNQQLLWRKLYDKIEMASQEAQGEMELVEMTNITYTVQIEHFTKYSLFLNNEGKAN